MENLTIDQRINKITELAGNDMKIKIVLPIGTYEVKESLLLKEHITISFV